MTRRAALYRLILWRERASMRIFSMLLFPCTRWAHSTCIFISFHFHFCPFICCAPRVFFCMFFSVFILIIHTFFVLLSVTLMPAYMRASVSVAWRAIKWANEKTEWENCWLTNIHGNSTHWKTPCTRHATDFMWSKCWYLYVLEKINRCEIDKNEWTSSEPKTKYKQKEWRQRKMRIKITLLPFVELNKWKSIYCMNSKRQKMTCRSTELTSSRIHK